MTHSFDPTRTYLHLAGPDAMRVDVGPTFWQELGDPQSDQMKRVAGDGWLVCAYILRGDPDHWEMHPAGDEVLFLVSGAVDLDFELPEGVKTVELRAGQTCVVPRGVWHRQRVRAPGQLLAMTWGRGTEHRPV
jgi:mannose-6-phosphate isomerase-like protein (cupin superfamily)